MGNRKRNGGRGTGDGKTEEGGGVQQCGMRLLRLTLFLLVMVFSPCWMLVRWGVRQSGMRLLRLTLFLFLVIK